MKRNQPVTVIRTNTVSGATKTIDYPNFKDAAKYAAIALVDNGWATKREAQEWQATIKDLGTYTYNTFQFDFMQVG